MKEEAIHSHRIPGGFGSLGFFYAIITVVLMTTSFRVDLSVSCSIDRSFFLCNAATVINHW